MGLFNAQTIERLFWDEVFFWLGGTALSLLLARVFQSLTIGIFMGIFITGVMSVLKTYLKGKWKRQGM